MNRKSVLVTVSILIALVLSASFVSASTSSFFDHFTNPVYADNWVSTGVAPTGAGSSIITLTANSTLISKPLFHHGVLTMNVSLANSTMTSALWGWAMQFGSPTFDTGAFFYYNGTSVYAVIGNATDPANQQIAVIPPFNVTEYAEYVIEWSYSSGYTPYFTFHVNGGTYTLIPTGSLLMLDYFSPPIVFTVTGTTSATKLNVDYVSVSDSIVTVQTTTSTATSTVPKTTTSTSTVSTTVTVPATSTSWTWVSSTYTYTVPSYTTVGTSTITGTAHTTTTLTETTTKASTTTTSLVTVTGYVVNTSTSTTTITTTANATTTSTSTVEAVATVFGFVSLIVVMGVVIVIAGIIFASRQHVGIPRGRSNQPI